MPYTKDNINKLVDINNNLEKSKIKTLFFSLPSSCELFSGFEQPRNRLIEFSNFDFWKNLMEYSLAQKFEIIYNFNLAQPVDIGSNNLSKQLEKLDKLLIELQKTGINKLRIYNIQLLEYISKYYPFFELYVSTVTNYKSIQEFKNLKLLYPNIKQIVPSQDMNKNFQLLDNIKNKLKLDVEIMCNDGCIQGCINFYNHHGMKDYEQNYLNGITCTTACEKLDNINPFKYLCQTNHVFPWELEEYKKIGITKFKLTGRDSIRDMDKQTANHAISLYYRYLKGIDDVKTLDDFPVILFLNNSRVKERLINLSVKDIIKFMPDIKYFKKYGNLCSSCCGAECRYCYNCADKIEKVFIRKQEELRKRTMPVCVISKTKV